MVNGAYDRQASFDSGKGRVGIELQAEAVIAGGGTQLHRRVLGKRVILAD